MVEHFGEEPNEKAEHKISLIAVSIGCYLLTSGLIFFMFNRAAVTPIASAVLGLLAGTFVVFIIMGISGTLREFSIKSPLLELTSTLKERIEYVKEDLAESKKDINEKISELNQNIQSINNTVNNMTTSSATSQSTGKAKSDAHLTSQIKIDNLGGVVKEVRQLATDMLSIKLEQYGYRSSNNPVVQSQLNSIEKREERLDNIVQELPNNEFDIQYYIDKGLIKNSAGKYEEAIKIYNVVLEKDQNNIIAMNNKGDSLNNLGRYEEAIAWLDKAIHLNPNYLPALINRGNALMFLGKYEEAIKYYDDALRNDPNSVLALNNKAKALVTLGRYEEANEFIDRALKINPNLAVAWANRKKGASRSNIGDKQR